VSEGSLLDMTVRELLDAIAARTPAPGGGGVAAIGTALAAALVGMAARFGEGGDTAARADALRARVAPLADADAAAYGAFLAAVRLPRADPARAAAVAEARDGASAVPGEIAEVAEEVSGLAAALVRDGNPNLRGDAAAAVMFAAAAAGTAAELVAANLGAQSHDARLDRARALAASTRDRAGDVCGDVSGEAHGGQA
jgi:methenyltetrahydrofolate cyclohydrolase